MTKMFCDRCGKDSDVLRVSASIAGHAQWRDRPPNIDIDLCVFCRGEFATEFRRLAAKFEAETVTS